MARLRIKLRRVSPHMKFKNIKKEAKRQQSPSNSRTIPAATFLKIYRLSLKVFVVLIFLLAATIVGLDLDANFKTKQSVDLKREELIKELKFWEDFIEDHRNYRDAYFQASILEYKLGNTPKAKTYVEKGLSLDPNSEDGQKIENLLNK